jgi:hypothetical protein
MNKWEDLSFIFIVVSSWEEGLYYKRIDQREELD